MNKYKWQIINEIALEKETNTSFNVNADSEYSARFRQYLADGGQVDPADPPQVVTRYVTKNTAYDRIEALYGATRLEQVCDLLNNLPKVQRRRYDDAQDIDCSNQDVILALQNLGIDPTQILY